jgi:hypothetical protein
MISQSEMVKWLEQQVVQGEIAKAILERVEKVPVLPPLPPENLSSHFTLQEMTYSATAISQGINNTPGSDQTAQLKKLCEVTLEGIRTLCGDNPVTITSGYRSPQLNAAIGGASNSAHMYGCAADFTISGYGTPKQICKFLQKSIVALEIDQLIWEYPSGTQWVHVGRAIPPSTTPRYQVLTISPAGTFNGLVG